MDDYNCDDKTMTMVFGDDDDNDDDDGVDVL